METKLDGKVAFVTGGSSGIGRATAIAFGREGAKVAIVARGVERGEQVVKEIKNLGAEALFIQADLSKSSDVEAAIASTVAHYGRLDCAFNNAADVGRLAFTNDFSEADFDQQINNNLKSVWLCLKFEIEQMLRQEPAGGAIVNTSSVNGLGGAPQASIYSTAKSGIIALTKTAAIENAKRGIRVNALIAGGFRTPMLEGVIRTLGGDDPQARQAVEDGFNNAIPMGRIGQPEEAAEAVIWLCSDAASYVTGHSMIVDGGMTASMR